MRSNTSHIDRFLSKIQIADGGCWLWTGGHTHNGYGRFAFDGTEERAHRFSYRYFIGDLPDYDPREAELDHLCRNRGCSNPTHLELVKHQTNIRRGLSGHTPLTDEARAKITAAITGKPKAWTPEWKAALSASRSTDACRAKMRAAWVRRKAEGRVRSKKESAA